MDIQCLYKTKNKIRQNEVKKLILEILKGSLKINSSTTGNNTDTFKILIGVRIITLRDGYKFKYLNGITKRIPIITSITIIMRNDFQTSFRKKVMDLISNCSPILGFFRNIIKSLNSTISNKNRLTKNYLKLI